MGLERGWECHPWSDSPPGGNLRQENDGSHLVPAKILFLGTPSNVLGNMLGAEQLIKLDLCTP